MQTKIWKLLLTALVAVLAIVGSPDHVQACPYESRACPPDLSECCCDRGVICVSSPWQCDQFCN